MISIMCVGALHLDGGTQSAARRRPSVLGLKGKALQCPAMINLPVQVRTSMAHRVATLLFSIAVIRITSIMGICNTCKVTGSRSILSKSRKSTPTDTHLSTARTGMDQTVVMRLFRTAITLIIWSTGACIIRMEIIAMIMVLCLWSRTKSPRDENDTNAIQLRSLGKAIARLAPQRRCSVRRLRRTARSSIAMMHAGSAVRASFQSASTRPIARGVQRIG
jgi:hypothetical protein